MAKKHLKFGADDEGDSMSFSSSKRAGGAVYGHKRPKGPLSLERLQEFAQREQSRSVSHIKQPKPPGNSATTTTSANESGNESDNEHTGSSSSRHEEDSRDSQRTSAYLGSAKTVYFDDSESESNICTTPIVTKKSLKIVKSSLLKVRQNLPVYQSRDKILRHITKNKTTVLLAETGSGKSTQIPQILLENDPNEVIAITQPRRVAAISLATRVSQEMGCRVGSKVGYSVRFQANTSANTQIKYLTDGMLLRELMIDPSLEKKYTTVILDEAHERTVLTDVLMGLLKRLQRQRPIRIVVMSATLDADKFSKFFDNAEILYVEGKMFPVQRMYLRQPIDDVVDGVIQSVCQINMSEPTGDVLVFLPGQDEIDKSVDRLNAIAGDLPKQAPLIVALPLYASLPPHLQQKTFDKLPPRRRKVILATNIAETSLTIPGVRYVVDSGLRKVRVWKPSLGLDTLFTSPISQASAQQRMGRAGREGPGKCYRLFTEASYGELVSETEPEILRTDVASTTLMLKRLGIDDVINFEWVQSPGKKAIESALMKLYGLKALDDSGKITSLGQKMVLLPVSPHLAAVLIRASETDLLSVVLDIVACLSVEDLMINPHPDKRDEINEKKRQLFGGGRENGDLVMIKEMYDMYRDLTDKRQQKEFCQTVGVNPRAIRNVGLVRKQLERYMGVTTEATNKFDPREVIKCFLSGYIANTALGLPDRRYRTVANSQNLSIHPSSMMFGRKVEAIVYMEYVYTSKGYARIVSPIDIEWLQEVAPHLLGRVKRA
jgi:ATP-dependent RNA helicase DHR2